MRSCFLIGAILALATAGNSPAQAVKVIEGGDEKTPVPAITAIKQTEQKKARVTYVVEGKDLKDADMAAAAAFLKKVCGSTRTVEGDPEVSLKDKTIVIKMSGKPKTEKPFYVTKLTPPTGDGDTYTLEVTAKGGKEGQAAAVEAVIELHSQQRGLKADARPKGEYVREGEGKAKVVLKK